MPFTFAMPAHACRPNKTFSNHSINHQQTTSSYCTFEQQLIMKKVVWAIFFTALLPPRCATTSLPLAFRHFVTATFGAALQACAPCRSLPCTAMHTTLAVGDLTSQVWKRQTNERNCRTNRLSVPFSCTHTLWNRQTRTGKTTNLHLNGTQFFALQNS